MLPLALALGVLGNGCDAGNSKQNDNDTVGTLFRALCEANARCAGADLETVDCSPDRFCFDAKIEPSKHLLGADACAKQLAAMHCEVYATSESVPSACMTGLLQVARLRGLSGPEESCHSQLDCFPDLLCSADAESVCGVCTPLPVEGERCGELGLCSSGAHCEDDERCHTNRVRGEACTRSDECRTFLSCLGGTCQPPALHEGEACGDDVEGECEGMLVCHDDSCQPLASEGEDCSTLSCGFGLVCADDTCAEPAACGEGQVGDPCYTNVCAPGLACDPTSSTCTEREQLGALGAECIFDGECQSGICIDGRCAAEQACQTPSSTQKASPRPTKSRAQRQARARNPLLWFGNTMR